MRNLFRLLIVLLPWALRRRVLVHGYGYVIHPTARIGLSWVFPRHLVLAEYARIGHLNVVINLDRVELGAHACVERSNWITGFPRDNPRHFFRQADREAVCVLGAHSAITKRHHLDCTDRIEIGAFTTLSGYASQLLTHTVNIVTNRQECAPIRIGDYCFVGTAVVVLPGARLPDRSVLGAKALLNKTHEAPGWLYAGVPAEPVKVLPADAAYFHRTNGFVD